MTPPPIQPILAAVDAEEIVELARSLIRCPSVNPPGNEQAAAHVLAAYLEGIGMDVQLQEVSPNRPNVIARLCTDPSGPTLLFNGHLDVVPAGDDWTVDPFGGDVVEGQLFGRGACDMKGPLAAIAGALSALRRTAAPWRGTVVLTAVVGEEFDQCGTRHLVEQDLVEQGIQADCAICAEPTGLVPVIAHKGEVYIDVTITGKAAHGSVPHRGVNAVAKAAQAIVELLRLGAELEQRTHPLCGSPTISVGTIQGGTITSTVPDRCTFSMDRRLSPGETFEQARGELEGVLDEFARGDPAFQYELAFPLICQPMEIAADQALVRSLRRQVQELTGRDPGVAGWSAACDATLLTNDAGIPTCIFGPGDLDGQAHQADERIDVAELVQAAQIYALTTLDLLR